MLLVSPTSSDWLIHNPHRQGLGQQQLVHVHIQQGMTSLAVTGLFTAPATHQEHIACTDVHMYSMYGHSWLPERLPRSCEAKAARALGGPLVVDAYYCGGPGPECDHATLVWGLAVKQPNMLLQEQQV